MSLTIANIPAVAHQLTHPFVVLPVAAIGELTLSVYVCQGQIEWHRHLDEDELFLVYEGVIALETGRGNLTLHADELAVVPKGVVHRSSSSLRSVVVLLRATVLTQRRNGHRQLYTLDTEPPLEKTRLARVVPLMTRPHHPMALARVEDFELQLLSVKDFGPSEVAPSYGALCWVLRGSVGIETDEGAGARLGPGDSTVIRAGTHYRMHAAETSLVLTLARLRPPEA
jgi:mannose-6-phosphate isomerase-like protein (cupin superfamily)